MVNDFNIERPTFGKAKADAPLVVDADAPLSFAVALERFEPVVGRNPEFLDANDTMKHGELAHRNDLDVSPPRNPVASKQRLRVTTTEGLDRHPTKTTETR